MWANYSDVTDRWVGGGVPADETQVTTLIGDAEDMILREFPDIQDRINLGITPVERVIRVTSRMVIRHLRNPDGQRSKTQGAGPFQESITFGGDEPGALYLTDADRHELAGPTSTKGKAFSIDLTPVGFVPLQPDTWVPIK